MTTPAEAGGWIVYALECDRHGTEWVLYGYSSDDDNQGPVLGRLDANGTPWFTGEFDRAAELWEAFSGQRQ